LGGDWINEKSAYYCPCYCFSPSGKSKTPWSITAPNPISLVEDKIKPIKENVEKYIIERGGQDFMKKLKFCNVDIVYLDSADKFERKKPEVDFTKCGLTKFYFRYIFEPTNDVKYKIGIATNYNGEVTSNDLFPHKKTNPNFDKLLSETQIRKKINWYRRIDNVYLYYNPMSNRFIYTISAKYHKTIYSSIHCFFWYLFHPKIRKGPCGKWYHKSYNYDANTGKIIYKERIYSRNWYL
jgi:hypothetical protein